MGKNNTIISTLLGALIPLVVVGLTVLDFLDDGKIHDNLLGLDLIFGLGALGWRLDNIVGQAIARKLSGGIPSGSEDEEK